jgi:hypothetical protein
LAHIQLSLDKIKHHSFFAFSFAVSQTQITGYILSLAISYSGKHVINLRRDPQGSLNEPNHTRLDSKPRPPIKNGGVQTSTPPGI